MAIISSQRHLFDIPDDVAYFNCSYNSPMLNSACDVLVKGAQEKLHPWQRTPANFFDDAQAMRTAAASALGGNAECYAVVPSASYGMSTAARILENHVGAGNEIIVLDEAFPSNYLPWHRLAETTGARLVVVPTPDDLNWTKAVIDHITDNTAVVAIPHCHWTNGARLNLVQISDETRTAGAALALDLTQSLGAMPFDFDQVKPDFVAAATYKWLLGPYGISLFYVDERWHNARPLEETWLGRKGAEQFENLVNYSHTYQPGARRFDMGQKNIPTLVPGSVVSLNQIARWGVKNIAETLAKTNTAIADGLSGTPLVALPQTVRSPHILGATAKAELPDHLLPALAEQKIFISRRGSSLRFAPHLHVSENDIDRLVSTIKTVFNC